MVLTVFSVEVGEPKAVITHFLTHETGLVAVRHAQNSFSTLAQPVYICDTSGTHLSAAEIWCHRSPPVHLHCRCRIPTNIIGKQMGEGAVFLRQQPSTSDAPFHQTIDASSPSGNTRRVFRLFRAVTASPHDRCAFTEMSGRYAEHKSTSHQFTP